MGYVICIYGEYWTRELQQGLLGKAFPRPRWEASLQFVTWRSWLKRRFPEADHFQESQVKDLF